MTDSWARRTRGHIYGTAAAAAPRRNDERASVAVSGDAAGTGGRARWATAAERLLLAVQPPAAWARDQLAWFRLSAGCRQRRLGCITTSILHLSISLFLPVSRSSAAVVCIDCLEAAVLQALINMTFRLTLPAIAST